MPFLVAFLFAITASAPAAGSRAAHAAPPKIGQPAPAFTLRDQHGKRVSVAAAAGTKSVLIFYRGYW